MATRTVVTFDIDEKLKKQVEGRFENYVTTWREVYMGLSRKLLEMSDDEVREMLVKEKTLSIVREEKILV